MKLIMTLRDGSRAAVMLPRELQGASGGLAALKPAASGERVSLVFYASDRQALDRILGRFGATGR
jgi:hypothetical protein